MIRTNDLMTVMVERQDDIKSRIKDLQLLSNKSDAAINSVVDSINIACATTGVDVCTLFDARYEGNAFDASILTKCGKHELFSFVRTDLKGVARKLYEMCPVGLHTPNQACGAGELMALVMSKDVQLVKNGGGDIIVSNENVKKIIELRGNAPRVCSKKRGIDVNNATVDIAQKFKVAQNQVKAPSRGAKTRKAVEPWDVSKKEHWEGQLSSLGRENAIQFMFECINTLGISLTEDMVNNCFVGTTMSITVDYEKLYKLMLKAFFAIDEKKWNNLVIINDGYARVITNSPEEFNKMVDDGVIKPTGPFIRVFQEHPVGFYYNI